MPANTRRRQPSPSRGSSELIVSVAATGASGARDVEFIIKFDGLTFAWEHYHVAPGPERPLWPAELGLHLLAFALWFSELEASDDVGKVHLRSSRPRFDYTGSQEVLPF